MNKKILIPLLAVVLLAGGYEGYSKATAMPPPKLKITGMIYVMPKDFTLNMAGGDYATLTVALVLAPTEVLATTDPANPPPTGFGDLPEEAAVRAIITNAVTGQPSSALISPDGRAKLEQVILTDIKQQTDVLVTHVFFTDLAVQ
ncbi:MAG: flagellar basal body-associated protein FliL [Solirubrobacteraceae bacterium]|jgi:flagellar FliL protein